MGRAGGRGTWCRGTEGAEPEKTPFGVSSQVFDRFHLVRFFRLRVFGYIDYLGAGTKRLQRSLWYGVPVNGGQSHLAYLESLDGIHWLRPHRVLEDPARIAFGASVLDEGPAYPDHERRYKFAWYNGGMMLARSADGLQWTADPPQPVITGINDILHLARDTARNRYIAVFGFPSRPEDGYKGKPHHAQEGYRRCVGQSTSADCLSWTTPRRIFAPDNQDDGITEFYSIGGVVTRGDMLIGLLKVLPGDLPWAPGGPTN